MIIENKNSKVSNLNNYKFIFNLVKRFGMKKSVLSLALLVGLTFVSAKTNSTVNTFDDEPIKVERIALKTNMLKAKWLKIQLKNTKDLNKSVVLLKELSKVIAKIERSND